MNPLTKDGRLRRVWVGAGVVVGLACLFASSFLHAGDSRGEKIVAAYYSDRYHVASCKVAQKIHKDDRVFYATPEEAIAAGLVPCKKCEPPMSSLPVDDRKKKR